LPGQGGRATVRSEEVQRPRLAPRAADKEHIVSSSAATPGRAFAIRSMRDAI
jgi:hypothetical protein